MIRHIRNIFIMFAAILAAALLPEFIRSTGLPSDIPMVASMIISVLINIQLFIVKLFHFVGLNDNRLILGTILSTTLLIYIFLVREKWTPSPQISTKKVIPVKDSGDEIAIVGMFIAGAFVILIIGGLGFLLWGLGGGGLSSFPLWITVFFVVAMVGIMGGVASLLSEKKGSKKGNPQSGGPTSG